MKKLIYIISFAIMVVACKPEENATTIKDETMRLHDSVMAGHSALIANQMRIDTLLQNISKFHAENPALDTVHEKKSLQMLHADLADAEESMNQWMHNFNADYSNKVNWEVVHYYKQQRDKIAKINDLYKNQIKRSTTYLTKFEK